MGEGANNPQRSSRKEPQEKNLVGRSAFSDSGDVEICSCPRQPFPVESANPTIRICEIPRQREARPRVARIDLGLAVHGAYITTFTTQIQGVSIEVVLTDDWTLTASMFGGPARGNLCPKGGLTH